MLFHAEKTEQLIRGFFEVQNEVGLGRAEEAYQRAYEIWASERGIPVLSKPRLRLTLRDQEVLVLYPDFVAWNDICIELKALPRTLGPSEELQLFDYLRAGKSRLGLLVNMGLDRVHFERRIFDRPPNTMGEDWSSWEGAVHGIDREIGLNVRAALQLVYETHRTGYSHAVTEKLVLAALRMSHLQVTVRPIAAAIFRKRVVHESNLDCFVIENRIVLTLTSQFTNNEFSKSLEYSYLKTLGLPWCVAANFGTANLQVTALSNRHAIG